MSSVVTSACAVKVTPPSSPPNIRRSSDGCGSSPTNIPSEFSKSRKINDPTHSEFFAAATLNSPPSITKRKCKHKKEVCSWKLGDDGDSPAICDSSGEFDAVISKHNYEQTNSSSTSTSTFKRGSKSHVSGGGNEELSSDIPQTVDEHAARLKEIIHKRERKKRKYKKKSAKHEDTSCSAVSADTINSKPATQQEIWSDVQIEKKYTTVIEADKESDVSGGSNTSSIFAATRAKLKGYLTSYSRKNIKNKRSQKGPTTGAASVARSPALNSLARTEHSQDEPVASTLFSIEESEPCSSLKEIRSRSPLTPTRSSSHKSCDELTSQISPLTPEAEEKGKSPSSIVPSSSAAPYLPCINLFPERDFTTRVIDLPWSVNNHLGKKDDDSEPREQQLTGQYSGPVNDFLQPHGKGKLILKSNTSQAFYGTWKDGKLVSPLTDEKEPATGDDSGKERRRGKDFTSLKADKNRRTPIDAPTSRESAALAKVRDKKRRKPKPKPLVRYKIGDACRTSQDMIICNSKHAATESAGLLKKWDGAFIKRSCGVWTYAVLIERAPQPVDVMKRRLEYFYWTTVEEVDPRCEMEDSMLFAIDGDGGTKIIPKHAWFNYVRRFNPTPLPNLAESSEV